MVLIASVVYVVPTFRPELWPHKKINLGLDLQGGINLALEVQTEKAVEGTVERARSDLRQTLRSEKIRHGEIRPAGRTGITLPLLNSGDLDNLRKVIEKNYPDIKIQSTAEEGNRTNVTLGLSDESASEIRKQSVQQALETIRNRIDQFGVSEPDIRLQGEDRILIQLPGVTDTQRAKELIGKTAQLEFKLLDEEHSVAQAQQGDVPPGDVVLYSSQPTGEENRPEAYLVRKETLLTGAYLQDARVQIDQQFNEPYVTIDFDRKGAQIFERVTGENVKKRLAIVLDNKVYSAPVIQERIPGGTARITGRFSMQEAHDLAIVLRAGALPAPVHIVEERTVGPSLGKDSINKGLFSMLVGGALVVLFMGIYYKFAGMVANAALILNIALIAAGLAAFQATLTLPGIAGIILTIGMAVDANVIIFERIREELRLGKTPASAIDAGFERATVTVIDANLTTLIAALVLYQFGTGSVKGFAVTLSLGVLASMFTALFVCRMIFDYFYTVRHKKTLSI